MRELATTVFWHVMEECETELINALLHPNAEGDKIILVIPFPVYHSGEAKGRWIQWDKFHRNPPMCLSHPNFISKMCPSPLWKRDLAGWFVITNFIAKGWVKVSFSAEIGGYEMEALPALNSKKRRKGEEGLSAGNEDTPGEFRGRQRN